MKSTKKILSGLIAISVLLSLLSGIASAQPVLRSALQQGGNLLNNPGFEGAYVEHSATLHVTEGWQAWWVPNRL